MEWYLKVLKENYANFSGRARRKEYWMFMLFNFIAMIILSVLGGLIKFPFIVIVYYLAVLVPSLALAIRRMHDLDKSGWMLLVGLIPLVGGIWLFILTVTEGTKGPNQYGVDPKDPNAEEMSDPELLDA